MKISINSQILICYLCNLALNSSISLKFFLILSFKYIEQMPNSKNPPELEFSLESMRTSSFSFFLFSSLNFFWNSSLVEFSGANTKTAALFVKWVIFFPKMISSVLYPESAQFPFADLGVSNPRISPKVAWLSLIA